MSELSHNFKSILWHRVFTDEDRLFLPACPIVETLIVESVLCVINIGVAIGYVAVYHAVRQYLYILIVAMRGDECFLPPLWQAVVAFPVLQT